MEGGGNTGGLLSFNILNNKKIPKLKHLLVPHGKKATVLFWKVTLLPRSCD